MTRSPVDHRHPTRFDMTPDRLRHLRRQGYAVPLSLIREAETQVREDQLVARLARLEALLERLAGGEVSR